VCHSPGSADASGDSRRFASAYSETVCFGGGSTAVITCATHSSMPAVAEVLLMGAQQRGDLGVAQLAHILVRDSNRG